MFNKGKLHIKKNQIYPSKEMIKSGVYFKEALSWYEDRFFSLRYFNTLYILISVAYFISVLFLINFALSIFPLKEKRIIVINRDREIGTYVGLKRLSKYSIPNHNIIMKAVENYVIQREEYTLENDSIKTPLNLINEKTEFILKNSSRSTFLEYYNWINNYNSITGDFLLSNIQTKVKIISFDFPKPNKTILARIYYFLLPQVNPNKAIVQFTSINARNRERKFIADIDFMFKMKKDKKDNQYKIFFKVTSYKVKKR